MGNYFATPAEKVRYMKSPDFFNDSEAVSRYVCELGAHDFVAIVSIGPVGVGKSSNLNTVASFLNSHLEQAAGCGVGTQSMTHKHQLHTISYQGRPVKWKWLDTPGDLFTGLVEKRKGVAVNCVTEAEYDAHVEEAIIKPMRYHQAGCVMAMLSAVEVSNSINFTDSRGKPLARPHIDPQCRLRANLAVLKHLATRLVREGMRMLIVLTKVDLIDASIEEDVSNVAFSQAVDVMRSAISAETGVPLNQVHVVVNLVRDFDPMDNLPLGQLALFNVRAALHAARHYHCGALHPSQSQNVAWQTFTEPTSLEGADGVTGRSHPVNAVDGGASLQREEEYYSLRNGDAGASGAGDSLREHSRAPHADVGDAFDRRSVGGFSEAVTDIDAVLMDEHKSLSQRGGGVC